MIQEELQLQSRLLTENSHETFVIQHCIEEAWKKLEHARMMKHRVDERNVENLREDVELKKKRCEAAALPHLGKAAKEGTTRIICTTRAPSLHSGPVSPGLGLFYFYLFLLF